MRASRVILNPFSILAAFLALLRTALSVGVCVSGVGDLRGRHAPPLAGAGGGGTPAPGAPAEGAAHHSALSLTLAAALAAVSVASWPMLYLVLQSYVPEWPGVMCVQGVRRVGLGSAGIASYLPSLLSALETLKPVLVFAAGAWFVLYRLERARRREGGSRRVTGALLLCAGLAAADGILELGYLGIPKREKQLASGCCTVGSTEEVAAALPPPPGPAARGAFLWGTFAAGALLVAGTALARGRLRRPRAARLWLALLVAGAILTLPLASAFLDAIAVPAFTKLPDHHCRYCLFGQAPESLLGIALFLAAAFSVGWAAIARCPGSTRAPSRSAASSRSLLSFAGFGYAASLALVAGRLLLP